MNAQHLTYTEALDRAASRKPAKKRDWPLSKADRATRDAMTAKLRAEMKM